MAAGIFVCDRRSAPAGCGGTRVGADVGDRLAVQVSEDVIGIHAAAERFLRALDDLDWDPFRASWASNPTVFFPFGDTPERVAGQAAVEARWRRFFEEARARRPGPPYLNLKPLDIRTERYGDVGLVTFTLELTVGGRQL
ncbi:MAG TPA: nuclear transport factor 2 family protein, partial [Methylomirabilota bacterium]|nr:nuclear transport factor 2 family protein [Methylomirabilota bacterium]